MLSAVYPTPCSLCGTPLPNLSYAPICDICWTEISAVSPDPAGCARCGDLLDTPALDTPAQQHCRACSLAKPAFEKAVFYGLYRGRMRDAIHALKYERLTPAAHRLGRMLASAIAQLHGEAPTRMLVVPVPLHRRRANKRGFNQTRLLARHALGALQRTHPDWMLSLAPRALFERTRNTESQAGLSPLQRRVNLRRAFRVNAPEAVAGKDILVVDDILTTGATARAAALALRRAGAASVWVATLARARRDANDFRIHPQFINQQSVNQPAGQHAEPLSTAVIFSSGSSFAPDKG
jgi:ComF family protein